MRVEPWHQGGHVKAWRGCSAEVKGGGMIWDNLEAGCLGDVCDAGVSPWWIESIWTVVWECLGCLVRGGFTGQAHRTSST